MNKFTIPISGKYLITIRKHVDLIKGKEGNRRAVKLQVPSVRVCWGAAAVHSLSSAIMTKSTSPQVQVRVPKLQVNKNRAPTATSMRAKHCGNKSSPLKVLITLWPAVSRSQRTAQKTIDSAHLLSREPMQWQPDVALQYWGRERNREGRKETLDARIVENGGKSGSKGET